MHRIKTYILDDEPLMVEGLVSLIEAKYGKHLNVVATQVKPKIAVEEIENLKPDLIFIDVDMPNINGFEVIRQCEYEVPNIVFITAYDQYAVDAFNINAVDYLLKPIDLERFDQTVQRIIKLEEAKALQTIRQIAKMGKSNAANNGEEVKRIGVLSKDGYTLLTMDEIMYVKANDNQTVIHLENGKTMKHSKNLRSLEAFLPEDQFLRISRFAIVKIHSIHVFNPADGGFFILSDNSKHAIGYTYKKKLKSFIKERYLH